MRKTGIARIAVAAGLSIAAMASVMPAIPAMAAVNYGTGTITINKDSNNADVTYKGYQIFKANVTDATDSSNTTGKTETNIAWASDAVKTAVETAIKAEDASYVGTTAEDAATFISGKITNTDNTTRVDSTSFANKLATAVDGLTTETSVTPGTAATIGEGYWLFVTDPTTTDSKTNAVGTAPIFAVVGGNTAVTVTEKTSVPTVDKKVKSSSENEYTYDADAERGQSVSYELTGTVADNIASYDKYQYTFTDTLSTGLDGDLSSVKVYIVNGTTSTEVPAAQYSPSLTSNVLTVSFDDLKSVKDSSGNAITVDKDTKVVVDYSASLNGNAVVGGSGNDNTVTLTYSNNPHSTGTGTTTQKSSKLFTYKLTLHKVDRTTEANLSGAKFTIANSDGKYVQSDGTLGDSAYEFSTDTDGTINVSGLDAGTYTVTETTAPDGYDKVDPFKFTITPTYDQSGQKLTALSNDLTATDSVIAGDTDGNTSDNVLTAKAGTGADATTGTVKVTVGDVKRTTMPLTGMDGVTFTWIAGGTVLAIGLANLIRMKRSSDGSAK